MTATVPPAEPPAEITAIAIGIPARDEADTIGACVRSVQAAAAASGLPTVIVVAADDCHDATAELAALAMAEMSDDITGTVVRVDRRAAGGARDDACRTAVGRLTTPARHVWLATTDADSTVPVDWLRRQLAWAESGADGVAGLVGLDAAAPAPLRVRARRLQRRLGAGVGHPHVYGANLGMRADRWLAAGGFPHATVGEDHAAWQAMRAEGANLVAVDDIVVHTSGRLVGRAPDGFASVLARLDRLTG